MNAIQSLQLKCIGQTSSSLYESEGGSPTFDTVPFKIDAGHNPHLGTFVLVARQGVENIFHYGRLVEGVEINTRANPLQMQQDTAYGMPRSDIRSSEKSPDLYRVMRIEVLGEAEFKDEQFSSSETQTLPQTGQAVYELPARFISVLLGTPTAKAENERPKPVFEWKNVAAPLCPSALYLGNVESGGDTIPFLLPIEAMARHMAVVGKTGVGKSYAAGVLIEELLKQGVQVIAFDILGDTVKTATDVRGRSLEAGTPEFKVPYYNIGWEEFSSFLVNLTPQQKEIVASAYGEIFDRASSSGAVGTQDFYSEITRVGNDFGQAAVAGRAVTRVRAALQGNSLLTDTEVDITRLFKVPFINIFVGRLGQWQRNLVVGATVRLLQRRRRKGEVPPFVFVLDEAHLFLPGGGTTTPSTSVIREMIRTARHDSIGVVLLSQSPSSMDKQALLTCNTRLVFALDPDDQRVIAGQMGDLPEVVLSRIPHMPRGRAILTSAADIMLHPVVIQIRERETEHTAHTPNLAQEAAEWRRKHQGD